MAIAECGLPGQVNVTKLKGKHCFLCEKKDAKKLGTETLPPNHSLAWMGPTCEDKSQKHAVYKKSRVSSRMIQFEAKFPTQLIVNYSWYIDKCERILVTMVILCSNTSMETRVPAKGRVESTEESTVTRGGEIRTVMRKDLMESGRWQNLLTDVT